jgi:putative membrane protein
MVENYIKKRLISHKKLAQERTILANERNMLAYVRTGFASFVLGIALIKLFDTHIKYVYAGYGALALGLILIIFGVVFYPLRKKRILSY